MEQLDSAKLSKGLVRLVIKSTKPSLNRQEPRYIPNEKVYLALSFNVYYKIPFSKGIIRRNQHE